MSEMEDCQTQSSEMDGQLHCPLCLDGYCRPRKLPGCKHTFCTACIHSYAQSSGPEERRPGIKLTCPVCPSQFEGPKSKDALVQWVKGLPLNYHLMVILQQKNEKKIFPCEPCDTRCSDLPGTEGCESGDTSHESRDTKRVPNAMFFCAVCEEAYCESCSQVHLSSRATMDHELVQTSRPDIGQIVLRGGSVQYCAQHLNKKVDFFCCKDMQFLCSDCALFWHKTCQPIVNSKAYSKTLNIDRIKAEIEGSFLQAETKLANILQMFQTRNEGVVSKMEEFKSEVAQVKLAFLSKIDDFEKMYLAAFESTTEQTKEASKVSEEKVKRLTAAFYTEKKILKGVLENSKDSETGIFCHTKHQQLKRDIEAIKEKVQAETPKLTYQFSSLVNKITKPDFRVGTFGVSTEKLNIENIPAVTKDTLNEVGSEESEDSKLSICPQAKPQYTDIQFGTVTGMLYENQGRQTAGANQASTCLPTSNENQTASRGRSKNRRKKRDSSYGDLSSP